MAPFPYSLSAMSTATSQWSYGLSATTNTLGWWIGRVAEPVYQAVTGPALSVAAFCRLQLARFARPSPAASPAVAVWDAPSVSAFAAPREHRLRVGSRRRART